MDFSYETGASKGLAQPDCQTLHQPYTRPTHPTPSLT